MNAGLSLLYSGLSDRRITLSMAWLPFMTAALVGVQVGRSLGGSMRVCLPASIVVSMGLRYYILELA
jgi:ammonia channel protein AmtB